MAVNMLELVQDEIIAWLETVRCRAIEISAMAHYSIARVTEDVERSDRRTGAVASHEALHEAAGMAFANSILNRVQPIFDKSAIELGERLAGGRCDLAMMPIPYKYFRHWRVEGAGQSIAEPVRGALFLLGNSAHYYLSNLTSLDVPNNSTLRHIAFHLTSAALEDRWQWIVRAPVRNLGPSGRVVQSGPLELRFLTKAEEEHERIRSGNGLSFPSWDFVYEGRAARRPIHLRTRLSYLTARKVSSYPQPDRKGSGALDELHVSDSAESLFNSILLSFQLLGFEPEGDGRLSQVAYPHWLLNARRTRPVSLPPSRPVFEACWVSIEDARHVSGLASKIPEGTFTGAQGLVEVALRRFHRAVNLGVSIAGLLEHVAALESVLEMRSIKDRWIVKARIERNSLEGYVEMHRRELWHLYKLRSKTVHGEIDPSDYCLGHAITRIRLIGSQMYRAILGVSHYPYRDGRSRETSLESFSITTYHPTIEYPGS
jgi:hypothetical protein